MTDSAPIPAHIAPHVFHPVALRYWNGHTIALFPALGQGCAIGTRTVQAFHIAEHGPQWGTPNAEHVMRNSRPATRSEAAATVAELERQGYAVRVLRRVPAALYHWNRGNA